MYTYMGFLFFCSFVSTHFYFLEFIKCVCGSRWMCCGGDVACYVECTNVVKKWQWSDSDNRCYQGRRGWLFTLGTPSRREPVGGSEIEQEQTNSIICTRRGLLPPSLHGKCCLPFFWCVLSPQSSRAHYIRNGYRLRAVTRKPGSAWLEDTPAMDLGHMN